MSSFFGKRRDAFTKRFGKKMTECKLLGEGQYGKVYLVDDAKTGQTVAVKMILKAGLKTKEDKEFMESELDIHSRLDHPNIIKLYDHFSDKKTYYLVLELMSGGELFDRIFDKKNPVHYTERKAATVIKNVTEALLYLHEQNIVHRDLKPENLLLPNKEDETHVKLCDLGIAADCSEPLEAPYGTLMYMAPEIIRNQPYQEEVDMWSLGTILFSMLCGYPPFFSNDQRELARKIVRSRIGFIPPDWEGVSESAKELVLKLLDRNQKTRFTAKDVLNHPWIENAEDTEIANVGARFREFKAKALLGAALGGIKAVGRFEGLLDGLDEHEGKDEDPSSPLH